MSKKSSRRWDSRHPDSTSNFWTKVCPNSTFLDNDRHLLDGHLCDLCFGIEIRASRGAIVRENDSDRNSRTCLAARSARRDDSRRDLGRDRAKEAAKMNVERAPCSVLNAVKTKSGRSWPAGRLCQGVQGKGWRCQD